MAIKDRWNRFVARKSVSSTSSSTGTGESSIATARPVVSAPAAPGHQPSRPPTTTPGGSDSPKPPGLLSKTFGSWKPSRSPKKPAKDEAGDKLHPSERPLTETNLHHQQLFGSFTMQFGRRRHSGVTAYSGISPGSSRRGSRDLSGGGGPGGGGGEVGAG